MQLSTRPRLLVLSVLIHGSQAVLAHDPIFGIGPHVLFKGGVETALEVAQEKAGEEKESELALEIVYGITGDWSAGINLPYAAKEDGMEIAKGSSDIQVFSKYRFWREDSLGLQESAAVMLAVNMDNGDETEIPPLGNGAMDIITGLTYGYESLKWYRWASVRYSLPGENDTGFLLGNKWLMDFVGGWRPTPPEYKRPDTVWLLELNGEITDKAKLNGGSLANSGGFEWFISPGIFWTYRNFAIKSGIQIPIANDLHGMQDKSDYRFKTTFEWHL
jgi:hypothetical protein